MRRPAYNREEVKQQFLYAVHCLGIERIRLANYKPVFRDDPVMLDLLDNWIAEAARLRRERRKAYYGPNASNTGQ